MSIVKVYSTATCPWCKKTKKLLDDNSISYQELDVGSDREARDEMVRKSGQMGVPVIEIEGEVGIGFDEGWLRERLGL